MDKEAAKRIIKELDQIFNNRDTLSGLLEVSKSNTISELLTRVVEGAKDGNANYHRLIRYMDEAILYEPEFAGSYFVRARMYIVVKLFDLARKDLEKVIELGDIELKPFAQEMLREIGNAEL